MERQNSKQGKLEKFAKNKIARATAAVALTFAAGSVVEKTTGYDAFPNVEVVHADGPNLLPNPSFETNSAGLPSGYVKTSAGLGGANYEFDTNPNNANPGDGGDSYISADLFGEPGDNCQYGNGFETSTAISIDPDKTYRLSFYARTDIDPPVGVDVNPATVFNFNDVSSTTLNKTYNQVTYGVWDNPSLLQVLIGPGKEIDPPDDATNVKIQFDIAAPLLPPSCANNTVVDTVSFDNVSLVEVIPLSVGGVAEAPNLAELQAIKDANKDDDSKLPLAAGAAAAAIAAGGALLYSRRRKAE